MEKLQLKAGLQGVAKIAAKGKGVLLDMPTLGSLEPPDHGAAPRCRHLLGGDLLDVAREHVRAVQGEIGLT